MILIMKRKLMCIISSAAILAMSVFGTVSVSAESTEDPLIAYKQRLDILNSKYNLDYMIPSETAHGGDYSEIVSFFSVMSLEEFDEYILSLEDENNSDSSDSEEIQIELEEEVSPLANDYLQKYIYGSNRNNYFYIVTDTIYADGYQRYIRLDDINYICVSYPSYKLQSSSCTFTNYSRNAQATFKALKYTSENICYTTLYTIPATFTAGGGDIYIGSYV